MIKYIKINGEDHPIAFSNKAIGTWSHAMRIPIASFASISDELTMLQLVHLLYYALQEGYAKAKKPFSISIDDCWEYTESNEGILGVTLNMLLEARTVKSDNAEPVEPEKKMI